MNRTQPHGCFRRATNRDNLKHSPVTVKGFDTDRSFILVEIADRDLYFETISRTGKVVDSADLPKQKSKSMLLARPLFDSR
jgi:hypothetical protein